MLSRKDIESLGYKYVEHYPLSGEHGFFIKAREQHISAQLFLRPYDAKSFMLKIFPETQNTPVFQKAVYTYEELETITKFFIWFFDPSQNISEFHEHIERDENQAYDLLNDKYKKVVKKAKALASFNKTLIRALGYKMEPNHGVVVGPADKPQCVWHNPSKETIEIFDVTDDKDWKIGDIIVFKALKFY